MSNSSERAARKSMRKAALITRLQDQPSRIKPEKVDALLDNGPSIVVLTRGSEGATGFLADGTEVHVPARRVKIKDTVGAGDTFNAGLLARLSERGCLSRDNLRDVPADVLRAALELGARVASVTVSRAGANPPWAEEL